jgi:hypothetical protein
LYQTSPPRMIGPEDRRFMLRRLLAALLIAAIALPLPAFANSDCSMRGPHPGAERCDCCDSPEGAPAGDCHSSASMPEGCNCSLRADAGGQPASTATNPPAASSVDIQVALIPASLSTPQRAPRALYRAASPPGTGSVSRPLLCTWLL